MNEYIIHKKTKILMSCIDIIGVLAIIILFTVCAVHEVRNNKTVKKTHEEKYGVIDYKDPETGVHYL